MCSWHNATGAVYRHESNHNPSLQYMTLQAWLWTHLRYVRFALFGSLCVFVLCFALHLFFTGREFVTSNK
jgi:hypothetical protein